MIVRDRAVNLRVSIRERDTTPAAASTTDVVHDTYSKSRAAALEVFHTLLDAWSMVENLNARAYS